MGERTETRELACKLTVEELALRRDRLIDVLDEVEAEESKLDAFKKATKGRCSVLEAERDKLRRAIRDRSEDRDVLCLWEHDYAAGMARLKRTDTGEVVADRPLTLDECQRDLPIEEPEGQGEEQEGQAVGALGYDPEVPDELEAEIVEVTPPRCDSCDVEISPSNEHGRCLECRAGEACVEAARLTWEPASKEKHTAAEIVEWWAALTAGGEFDGVRVPVVDIVIETVGCVRKGRWVMIRKLDRGA